VIKWKRPRNGQTLSHCGRWEIRPVRGTRIKVLSYELLLEGEVVAERATVKACKLHAIRLNDDNNVPLCKGEGYHVFALGADRCSVCGWNRYERENNEL